MADGLGGQMSRYALGRYLAIKNQTDLFFDISFYQSKHNFSECDTRSFGLNQFNIKAQIANERQIRRLKTNRYLKRLGFIKSTHIIKDFDAFEINNFKLKDDCYIESGIASLRTWSEIRPLLLQEFSLKEEFKLDDKLTDLILSNTVALHCRRGDKANNPKVNQVHGVCSIEYYQQSIKYLQEHLSDFNLLIFSDEPDWVEVNLRFSQPVKFVADLHLTDNQELILMSRCHHQITANSGFSWWAAWLNDSPEKIVITPQKQCNDLSLSARSAIPESWVRI